MSESSPPSAVAPSSKRPLEEPSSPSGPGDQPDAKRPALDKILKEEPEIEPAIVTPLVSDEVKDQGEAKNGTNGNSDVDTTVPDAPGPAASDILNGEQNPNQRQDESSWLHVRAIISSAEAATVIGKSGENVSQIRKLSAARCTVSDYARGATERILTVSGKVDAVSKAFGLIIRTLNQEPLEGTSTSASKTYPLRLLIPHILVGSIIGKGGARIREIQEASGARLNASESTLPLSTERSLVVLGVADAVHIATYYICSTLVEQLTERFGGPAASAYASRSGHQTGAVPGGMQVVPYMPQSSGGQWGHPEHFRRNAQPGRPPQQPQPVAAYGQQPPVAAYGQPLPVQGQNPLHYPTAGPRSAGGYAGAGPHQPSGYGPPQTPHVAQPPAAQPMAGHGQQPVTQQIYIPNDMVGAIIGKGGAKINEIRQLSGSVIKINEPQDNSNERLVTITGPAECNQMALYMLYSRLETEKHRI